MIFGCFLLEFRDWFYSVAFVLCDYYFFIIQLMQHTYNLQDTPFLWIRDWSKTVEIRLFDDKRKQLWLLDTIVFKNVEFGSIEKSVVGLTYHKSFEALINHYPDGTFWPIEKTDLISKLYTFYDKTKETELWVLAINLDDIE